ncbi:hypothetical protein D3C77_697870 [compost metagenome]
MSSMFGNKKTYVMVNKVTGARIQCTEKYLPYWLSKGFEVEEILNATAEDKKDE